MRLLHAADAGEISAALFATAPLGEPSSREAALSHLSLSLGKAVQRHRETFGALPRDLVLAVGPLSPTDDAGLASIIFSKSCQFPAPRGAGGVGGDAGGGAYAAESELCRLLHPALESLLGFAEQDPSFCAIRAQQEHQHHPQKHPAASAPARAAVQAVATNFPLRGGPVLYGCFPDGCEAAGVVALQAGRPNAEALAAAAELTREARRREREGAADGGGGAPAPPRGQRTTHDDPNFMSSFFKASRLHFIGSWKARYQQIVDRQPPPPPLPSVPPGASRTLLHIDLDCFFVSVSCRGRPELGRVPVAVCWGDASSPNARHAEISSAI